MFLLTRIGLRLVRGAKLTIFAARNSFLSCHPRHSTREGCPTAALPFPPVWASLLPLLQESPPREAAGSSDLFHPLPSLVAVVHVELKEVFWRDQWGARQRSCRLLPELFCGNRVISVSFLALQITNLPLRVEYGLLNIIVR